MSGTILLLNTSGEWNRAIIRLRYDTTHGWSDIQAHNGHSGWGNVESNNTHRWWPHPGSNSSHRDWGVHIDEADKLIHYTIDTWNGIYIDTRYHKISPLDPSIWGTGWNSSCFVQKGPVLFSHFQARWREHTKLVLSLYLCLVGTYFILIPHPYFNNHNHR